MKPIDNIQDFYIFGRPIVLPIGTLYPTLVKDLPELFQYYNILTINKVSISKQIMEYKRVVIDYYKEIGLEEEIDDFNNLIRELILVIETSDIFDLLIGSKISKDKNGDDDTDILYSLYQQARELFELVFKEDVFHKINNEDEFQDYLEIIRKVNAIEFEKPNPNPAIERRNELKRLLKSKKGDNITYEAIITSVQVATGLDVFNLTIYQLNKIFSRIVSFKNHDLTKLYSMMDGEVKVENWFATHEEEDNTTYLTQEELDRAKAGKMMSDIDTKTKEEL